MLNVQNVIVQNYLIGYARFVVTTRILWLCLQKRKKNPEEILITHMNKLDATDKKDISYESMALRKERKWR
jgi:hypothetical protein